MKTTLTTNPAARAKRWRFNPLSSLQPAILARHLDAFDAGQLREAALIWDALEQPASLDDLVGHLLARYTDPEGTMAEDIDRALRALLDDGVVVELGDG